MTAVCQQGGVIVIRISLLLCLNLPVPQTPLTTLQCRMCDRKAREVPLVGHMHLLALLAEITTSPRTPWYLQGIYIIMH